MLDTKQQIQEACRTPSRIHSLKKLSRYIILKLQKIKNKKILKEARGKEIPIEEKKELHLTPPQKPCKQEENANEIFKILREKNHLEFFTLPNYTSKVKEKYFLRQTKIERISCH